VFSVFGKYILITYQDLNLLFQNKTCWKSDNSENRKLLLTSYEQHR